MQQSDFVDIDLEFEYTGASFADGIDAFMRNVLEYQMYFETMSWTKDELKYISEQLVQTGKIFAANQGFSHGGGTSLLHFSSKTNKFGTTTGYDLDEITVGAGPTGRLMAGIKSEVNGNSIKFYNDARNDRNQPYAGHMEYGFHARDGKFIPARPFMRPAMYAVAEGSRGNFQQIMKGMLDNLWTMQGFHGISTMMFGRKAGSQSLFWKQNGSFGSKLSQRSRMGELRGEKHRKQLSANRRVEKAGKSGKGHKGYRYSKVNKDFRPRVGLRTQKFRELKNWEQKKASSQQKTSSSRRTSSQRTRRTNSKSYNLKTRSYQKYDDSYTKWITSDGKAHPSRNAAEYHAFSNKLNPTFTREYVERYSYERSSTSYKGQFSFKERK